MSAKDERTDRDERRPRVVCTACDFAWYSVQMSEGLRWLGACPRCGGELHFNEPATARSVEASPVPAAPPHLALGLPRPRPR